MTTRNIIISIVVALLLGIGLGWWLGSLRKEVKVREEVRYIERTPIRIDTELFPKPTKVEPLEFPRLQYADTIRERIPVDTAEIVADYLQRRTYDLDFSTDTTGVYKVRAVVEANRLASASATIIPLQREVESTVVKVRAFRPFAEVGLVLGDKVGATLGAGAIIKEKHIVTAKYMRLGNHNYYGAEYGYIFGK